ncbi:MAG: hypothetical protein EXS29_00745 [Pedosphaera sp.]|nr:hypothetical protein [Pedosphaera sp.]MSS99828.1 hypothetical protein [Pedosphaera sp.]
MVKARENIVTFAPLRDIRLAAKVVIETARHLAPGVSEAVVQEREEAAHERGLEEGRLEMEAGFPARLDQTRREWESSAQAEAIRRLGQLEQSINTQISDKLKALEEPLVVLATEAAIKLVNGLPIDVPMVEAAVREALALVEQNAEVTIFLHPEDLALLKEGGSELLSPAPHARKLSFVINPQVSRGGCLVETTHGLIDAQRETRIELLRRAIRE